MLKIPKKIILGEEEVIIIQKDLKNKKGYVKFDKVLKIFINKNQPEIGKWIILIHEIIHIIDESNVEQKLYKKSLTEKQVQYMAGGLTMILLTGGIKLPQLKITDKEVQNFLQ